MAARPWDVSTLHRETPAGWRPSPARIGRRPCSSSGPAGAGGCAGLGARTALGRIQSPSSSSPGAQAPPPRPRRPDCGVQRGGAAGWPLATVCVLVAVGAPGWWPQVLAAAPQGHGGMGGHAVLGAVAGNAFFHWRFNWRIAVLVVACPLVPWAWHGPPPSPWSGPGGSLRPAVSAWRCDRDSLPPADRSWFRQKPAPSPRAGGGDAVELAADWIPVCEPEEA